MYYKRLQHKTSMISEAVVTVVADSTGLHKQNMLGLAAWHPGLSLVCVADHTVFLLNVILS